MFDPIKAERRFGMYRYANTDLERQLAAIVDKGYENALERQLRHARRMTCRAEARQLRTLAEFAAARPGKTPEEPFHEWAADELSVLMNWTHAFAYARLELAQTVTRRLPGTLAALERGDIDLRAVQAMAEVTKPLDDATARQVEQAVLPKAATKNTSQLRQAARRAVLRFDPHGAAQRHQARKRDRCLKLYPLDDAMAELTAYLPAAEATAIYQRIDAFAHAAGAEDERSMEQRRADVFADLLLGTYTGPHTGPGGAGGAGAGGRGATVQVTVPASTLMGADDQPGDLAGYGPIPADVARDIAANGTWKRLLHDPMNGTLLDYGTTTYRPPTNLANFVRARDLTCVFPGCIRRADACDIDHRERYPDGPTSQENLQCLCRHHHRLKHEAGWTVEYENGAHIWITPDGRRYRREPQPIAEPVTGPPPPAPAPAPAPAKPKDEPPPPF